MALTRSLAPAIRPTLLGVSILLATWAGGPQVAVAQPLADSASSHDDHDGRDGPGLYFKENLACRADPNCRIPASSVYPNPNDYTTLITLVLPEGSYQLTAKVNAFSKDASGYFNFECAVLDMAGNVALDYASFDGFFGSTAYLQAPVTFKARHGGNVRVGCRVSGINADGSLTDMHVWNVNLAALPVRSVKRSYQ